MRKVIFLDIDGVLNNEQFHKNWMIQHTTPHTNFEDRDRDELYLENRFDSMFVNVTCSPFFNGYIAPDNLEQWNRLVDELGDAEIILSSDWRFIQDGTYSNLAHIDMVRELFERRGIKGNVIGSTPYIKDHDRATEIIEYIKQHLEDFTREDVLVVIYDDLDIAAKLSMLLKELKDQYFQKTLLTVNFIMTYNQIGLTEEDRLVALSWFNSRR